MLHYARALLGRKASGPIITIAPTSQSLSGSVSSQTFSNETVTVTNGVASSYTWGFTDLNGGTWTINSGQGTATAAPRVTGIAAGEAGAATLYCDVVVSGTTYRKTVPLDYSRTV